jgi:hypothetical protein
VTTTLAIPNYCMHAEMCILVQIGAAADSMLDHTIHPI